ncbi:MAG: SoxR reducing system RseC family protein [Bacteroidota bacterium]|nr:SoxR reducing system RseC family protein [Bacteroidota bacterium]
MIEHEGIVLSVNDSKVIVRIIKQSACSGCHAKGVCTSVDQSEILLEVSHEAGNLHPGQKVVLEGRTEMGMKAVLYAFVIPLGLIMTMLFISAAYIPNEILSAVFTLLIVVPYYWGLYLKRDRLKRKFSFRIKTSQ